MIFESFLQLNSLKVDHDARRNPGIVLPEPEEVGVQVVGLKDTPFDVRDQLGIDSTAKGKRERRVTDKT